MGKDVSNYILFFKNYLLIWKCSRERRWDRHVNSLTTGLQQPVLDQAAVRSLGRQLSLPHGWQGPGALIIFCCSRRSTSTEPDHKWNIRGSESAHMGCWYCRRWNSQLCQPPTPTSKRYLENLDLRIFPQNRLVYPEISFFFPWTSVSRKQAVIHPWKDIQFQTVL